MRHNVAGMSKAIGEIRRLEVIAEFEVVAGGAGRLLAQLLPIAERAGELLDDVR
jgi:hypothetical protein